MPRYAVPVTMADVFSRFIAGDDEAEIRRIAANSGMPDPWTSDWTFEIVGEPVLGDIRPLGKDGERLFANLDVPTTSKRTIAVRADTPEKAREAAVAECSRYGSVDVDDTAPDNWRTRSGSRTVTAGRPRRDDGAIRPRRSFQVDVRRLISPTTSLHPLEVDQAFELMRWMVDTSRNYEQRCTWHTQKVWHLLAGSRSLGGDEAVPMVTGEKDLKDRFVHAVLGLGYDIYDQWREDHGIHPTARLEIEALHHGPNTSRFDSRIRPRSAHRMGGMCETLFTMMRELPGMTLSRQLNSCHAGARIIDSFGVVVEPSGFLFRIRYGYEGSLWTHDVAKTRGGETFAETMDRAIVLVSGLVPDYAEQLEARRGARTTATTSVDA